MALFGVGLEKDPRTKPWAKITDGKRLVEVKEQLPGAILVEDCLDDHTFQISYAALDGVGSMMTAQKPKWRLVQKAPEAPDSADGIVAQQ